MRYLAQRPRSELEIRRRLQRAGVDDDAAVDAVLAQLRQQAVVDDAEFARYWLEQRRTFKPRGARLLQAELRQYGIDAAAAAAAAAQVTGSASDDAYRAAAKRARVLRGADERTFTTRLSQFLARRGFDWDTIKLVSERLWAETSDVRAKKAAEHLENDSKSR